MSEKREQSRLEATLREAQSLSDEDTKILQAALAWDVEDVETAKRLMEESEASQVWPEGSPERRLIELRAAETAERLAAAPPDGWQGTEPAQGTRRELIRNALRDRMGGDTRGLVGLDAASLAYADVVEEALLKVVDQGASPESGSPASVAMNVLDRMEIDRTRGGKILTIAERVTELADELVEDRRECDARQVTIDELASVVDVQRRVIGKIGELGKVPSGTRELRVVLEDVTEVDKPPEYRFVEIDNQDGANVGFPMVNSSTGSLKEIVIPYARGDAWVGEVATQAAGAAFGVALEDHPDYVFPTERVSERVRSLLRDFDITVDEPRAEELLEDGREETAPAVKDREASDAPAENSRPLDDFDLVDAARRELIERIECGAMANQGLVFLVWRLGR